MREVILTANRRWFDVAGEGSEARFEERAIAWLTEHFGEDCVHARADLDEEAYHIHAVIVPRTKARDGRRVLQPSKHPMIRSYEDAQDSIGAWFAELGLVRGEKRAEAIRDATRHNARIREDAAQGVPDVLLPELAEVPKPRQHVSPRKWREAQEVELINSKKKIEKKERDLTAQAAQLAGREVDLADKERTAAHQVQQMKARQDIVADQEQMVRQREIKLASKEAQVSAREVRADTKHRTAEAMISVAKQVAAGDVEVAEKPDPADKASNDPVRIARHQAAILFGRALQALRLKVRVDVEAEISEARGEIRAADDVIVDIARRLPTPLRTQIAEARKSLTLRIMALGQMAKRQFRNRDHERPEK